MSNYRLNQLLVIFINCNEKNFKINNKLLYMCYSSYLIVYIFLNLIHFINNVLTHNINIVYYRKLGVYMFITCSTIGIIWLSVFGSLFVTLLHEGGGSIYIY